ncbi:MAG: hypothetical protein FJZ16_01770 [Candidatus Omnitrophica bacterium]|nr:hypothetical protein [Candidatus Omnitrophota bacterium]
MLNTIFKIKSVYIIMLIAILNISLFPPDVFGLPVKSKEVSSESRLQNIEKILGVFKNDIAKKRLLSLRISERDLKTRLERLSDSQLSALSKNVDMMNIGADAGGVAIVIVVVVLLIIAILYFTDYAIKVEPKHK